MFNDTIIVRGAKVHNLKNINVDIPLGKIVAISGVSGSGKSSLALGVLYAEGSRRYLEALSTYTRRRITQSGRANVDKIEHVPASLALHQRPNVPGIRSTFGTSTELLNSLRLLFSRCGSYTCPNGHLLEPSINVALEKPLKCPECGIEFHGLSAEEYAFNSDGACPRCSGTGITRDVDTDKLIPDENLTLEEGAVKPWNMFGLNIMYLVAKEMGVRIDVAYKDLTEKEKDIIFHGSEETKHIYYNTTEKSFDLNFKYRNAVEAVRVALKNAKTEKSLTRINRFLSTKTCPECHGSRLNKKANATLLNGINLETATKMTIKELVNWIPETINTLPDTVKQMAKDIQQEFMDNANSLLDLGLDYITLDRASSTLSTGELQRVQLARTVRNRTTGILYVLDEPSIGLHPLNIEGLIKMINRLIDDGNSIILVDHDTKILKIADYMIEIGPQSGTDGGEIIAQGTIKEIEDNKNSIISGYLTGKENINIRRKTPKNEIFENGIIKLETTPIHTVKSLNLEIPKNRMTVITGVSGSGKTTMILESLYPAIKNKIDNKKLPNHIKSIDTSKINKVSLIDATPIGKNVRSTLATYSGILTNLRKLYAKQDTNHEYTMKDFSYNTGSLRCPTCNGTGTIKMDVQFLPDVEITCPDCKGLRYSDRTDKIKYNNLSIKDTMTLTVDEAIKKFHKIPKIKNKLTTLSNLGLGYLTLGEATPALSGGEAQRLKLASDINKKQENNLFIFDEPTIGLHPQDVKLLIKIFQKLIDNKATVIIIEHDQDLIKNADYIIDMGPGGGINGGEIIAQGTLEDIKNNPESITGKCLQKE